MRRSHDHLKVKGVTECPSCHQPILPHRVCMFCGKYKNREVIEVAEA